MPCLRGIFATMQFISRLKISSKFKMCFGALFLLIVGTGGIGTISTNRLEAGVKDLMSDVLVGIDTLGQVGVNVARHRAALGLELLAVDPQAKETAVQRQKANIEAFETAWRTYEPTVSAGEARLLADAVKTAMAEYRRDSDQVSALIRRGDQAGAAALYAGSSYTSYHRAIDSIRADEDYNTAMGHQQAERAHATYITSLWTIGTATLLAAILAIAASVWLNAGVVKRVVRLSAAMGRLARRDYAFDLPDSALADELGDLARALESCRTGLREADQLTEAQAVEQSVKTKRAEQIGGLTRGFETRAGEMIQTLASAATELGATAGAMTHAADRTSTRATAVASAAATPTPTFRRSQRRPNNSPPRWPRSPARCRSPRRSPIRRWRKPSAPMWPSAVCPRPRNGSARW
jgi:methyl-accepting chemotaxis protein